MGAGRGQATITWDENPQLRLAQRIIHRRLPTMKGPQQTEIFNALFQDILEECGFENGQIPTKSEKITVQWRDRKKPKYKHRWASTREWPRSGEGEKAQGYIKLQDEILEVAKRLGFTSIVSEDQAVEIWSDDDEDEEEEVEVVAPKSRGGKHKTTTTKGTKKPAKKKGAKKSEPEIDAEESSEYEELEGYVVLGLAPHNPDGPQFKNITVPYADKAKKKFRGKRILDEEEGEADAEAEAEAEE